MTTLEKQSLNNELKKGTLAIATNTNSPYCEVFDIAKTTEKAIQLKGLKGNVWLPKTGLTFTQNTDPKYPTFTFSKWFRNKLKEENNNYPWFTLFGWS